MDERLLDGLAKKIREYERELKSLYERKKDIETKIEELRTYLEHYSAVYEKESGKPLPETETTPRKKLTIAEAAAQILKEAGEPLKASYIAKEIIKRGVAQLSEKHGASVAISTMRRFPEIFQPEGNGYYRLKK